MSNITQFKVFNSEGTSMNQRMEDGILKIPVNLSRISTGLIATESFYFLEKTINGGVTSYNKPLLSSAQLSIKSNEERFFIFRIVDNEIIMDNDISPMLPFVNQTLQTFTDGYRDASIINATPLILHMGFLSNEFGNWEGEIEVNIFDQKIVFECYCEAVEQDDRFTLLLNRFGEKVGIEEERIFAETNIENDIQDNLFLNNRRQEYLNLISELQVYFPTVRGYDTILYYFGWKDILSVKEYYYDSSTNKMRHFDINSNDTAKLNLQKLSSYGLFYKINSVDYSTVDENGNPTTTDVLTIPYEELAIKMFYLKRFLESRNIGGISNIIDIIGEKTSFTKLKIRNWNNKVEWWNINKDLLPTVEIIESTGYLVNTNEFYDMVCPYDSQTDVSVLQVADLENCQVSDFAESDTNSTLNFDDPLVEIGSNLIFKNTSFDVTWEDIDINWLVLGSPQVVTWLNVGGLLYYAGKIKITGENGFVYEESFNTNDKDTFELVLPHIGYYTLVLELIGFDGRRDKRTFEKWVYITAKQIEIANFFKIIDWKLQLWETNNLCWNDIMANWNDNVYSNNQFIIEDIAQSFDLFDLARYLEYRELEEGFKALNWYDYPNESWNSLEFLSFDDSEYDTPRVPNAIATWWETGNSVWMNKNVYDISQTINPANIIVMAEDLESQHEGLQFIPRVDYNGQRFIHISPSLLQSNSDFYIGYKGTITDIQSAIDLNNFNSFVQGFGYWGSWADLEIPWEYTETLYRTFSVLEPFNTENIRVYKNHLTMPKNMPLFITNEVSEIVGKVISEIDISDENNNIITTLTGSNSSYRFTETGLYSFNLRIEDNEGNPHNNFRKNIINVVEHGEFRTLQDKGHPIKR